MALTTNQIIGIIMIGIALLLVIVIAVLTRKKRKYIDPRDDNADINDYVDEKPYVRQEYEFNDEDDTEDPTQRQYVTYVRDE